MNHHTDPLLTEETPKAVASQVKKRNVIAGAAMVVAIVGTIAVLNLPSTRTQGVGTYRNWSADAMIQGGAITEKELLQKYDQNASGIQSVFRHYGISRSDLTGETSDIMHGVVYQDGRVVVDGKTVATGAFSVSRKPFYDSRGNAPKKVTIGGTTFYEGPNMSIFVRPVDAYVFYRDGQFYKAVISSCANPVMGTPTEKPKANPVYSCDNLKATKIDRVRFSFAADATALNGASVKNYTYDFGDGSKMTGGNTVEHTYKKPGTYTIRVTANITVNGKTLAITGDNCVVTVTVEEPPKVALYTCDSLTPRAIQGKDRTYAFDLRYTAENANLKKAVFNFGDGESEEFSKDKATAVEHQYAEPGTYTTTVTLYFDVTGKGTQSASCKATITVPEADNCPLPGKEDLPKNSPECIEPPIETPPELPQTGLGEWLAAGAGLAALAAALYYYNISQKNLKETMLKK